MTMSALSRLEDFFTYLGLCLPHSRNGGSLPQPNHQGSTHPVTDP